jgi:hypothetical protein
MANNYEQRIQLYNKIKSLNVKIYFDCKLAVSPQTAKEYLEDVLEKDIEITQIREYSFPLYYDKLEKYSQKIQNYFQEKKEDDKYLKKILHKFLQYVNIAKKLFYQGNPEFAEIRSDDINYLIHQSGKKKKQKGGKSTENNLKILALTQNLLDEIKFLNRGGGGSIFSVTVDKKWTFVVKMVNISPFLFKKNNLLNNQYSRWRELTVLQWCTQQVLKKHTQCLPLLYDYKICEKERKLIIYAELAQGSVLDWCLEKHSANEWKCLLFHLFYLAYIFQEKFQLIHNDFTWTNILFYKTAPQGYWKYSLDHYTWHVPNLGYFFVAWDFGSCQSLKFNNTKEEALSVKNKLEKRTHQDTTFFFDFVKRIQMRLLCNRYQLEEFGKYLTEEKDKAYYNNAIKEVHDKLEKFKNVKREMLILQRNIAFYMIEKGLFDRLYEERKEKYQDPKEEFILPPPEIEKFIKSWRDEFTTLQAPIYYLQKYFKNYQNKQNEIVDTFKWS